MSLSKLFSLFALVSLASVSVAACAANTDATDDEGSSSSADEDLKKSIQACNTDDDCVAVSKGGCCDNGYLEAVNKHHVKAYENATKCTANPRPFCPLFMVKDTRVAECNTSKKKCEMVAIDDIACGGSSVNPHTCPDGYDCTGKALLVDGTGKCEEADAGPKDCRDNGCSSGQTCSFCWGSYACIPKGAVC